MIVKPGDEVSAFPWVCEPLKTVAKGMTLRDYFAAQAMQGLIASPRKLQGKSDITDEDYAEAAYWIADKMMKARDAA